MRRWMRVAGIVGAGGLVAAQFVRPARTNPPTDPARTLHAHRPAGAAVMAALDRACRDCHSNDTRWPWYSNVAPISWFVIDHVNHGRSHFNYSEWMRYDAHESRRLLDAACRLTRERDMPLPSYTWIHRNARLTSPEIDALCSWTQPEVTRGRDSELGDSELNKTYEPQNPLNP